MELKEVLSNLCYWDRRNPDFQIEEEFGYDKEEVEATGNFAKKDCYCDNCFYGRAKLAEMILAGISPVGLIKRRQNSGNHYYSLMQCLSHIKEGKGIVMITNTPDKVKEDFKQFFNVDVDLISNQKHKKETNVFTLKLKREVE